MDQEGQIFGMQWTTLTTLCKSNVKVKDGINDLYGRVTFPYKIRSHFAAWIEAQPWSMDLNCENGQRKAENLYKELVMKLEEHESRISNAQTYDLEKSLDWSQTKDSLKKAFDNNFITFVEVVRACLETEQELIATALTDNTNLKRKPATGPTAPVENVELGHRLAGLRQQIVFADSNVLDVMRKQDEFYTEYIDYQDRVHNLDTAGSKDMMDVKTAMEKDMNYKGHENLTRRTEMTKQYMSLRQQLTEILAVIWNDIDKFLDEQKQSIALLVIPKPGTIDVLDRLCEDAGRMLISLIIQVNTAITVVQKLPYPEDRSNADLDFLLKGLMTDLMKEHLKRILVVERNIPDRVLKVSSGKSLGFSVTLRLLGGNGLGLSSNPPKVQMSLFLDKDIPTDTTYRDGACQIVNGHERTFSVNRGTNSYVAQFQSIMLKSVKRPDKGKNEELLVTEHKYAFVFYTSLPICGTTFPVMVISLPIILTSQTSQEIMAKGTLIWDAAFSEPHRAPFAYRDSVPWSEMARVLDTLFKNNTGRGLEKEHLDYLAKMAFRYREPRRGQDRATPAIDNFDNEPLTEKLAIRDKLPGREFSFWKWVYACMNLVRQHVKVEWTDGRIFGFISKENAKRKLSDKPIGTFLLRFSETNIESSQKADISGFLTLAVMEIDPQSGQKKLFHIKEYLCPKEIQEKGLSPILLAMEVVEYANPGRKKPLLKHLWPDTSKSFNEIFGHYIEKRESEDDGYKRGRFTVEIYLDDEQAPRHRHDSVSIDGNDGISNPSSVQSSMSVNSPGSFDMYESTPNEYASARFAESNRIDVIQPMTPPQRPFVAVRPQGYVIPAVQQQHMQEVLQPYFQQDMQAGNVVGLPTDDDFETLMRFLPPDLELDEDGDLILSSLNLLNSDEHQARTN